MSYVLAIDPGTTQSAYVLWDGKQIEQSNILPNEDLVDVLCNSLFEAFPPAPIQCAIEMIAHYGTGMPAGKEVFETCVWIGEFSQAWKCSQFNPYGVKPDLIERRHIKMHHCQSNRAKDPHIRQALIDKYGAPGTKKSKGVTYGMKSHLWASFALATYVTETQYMGKLQGVA